MPGSNPAPTDPEPQPELRPLVDLLPRRRGRRPRAGATDLSRERIVHTAIQLADSEGPGAISMRRIAAQLGVGTMTVYGHVANREALLAYMIDETLAEAEIPDRLSGDWRGDLELLARQFQAVCRRHTWLPLLLGGSPYLLAPRVLPAVEFCLAALEPFGTDMSRAGAVLKLINSYVVGSTVRETTEAHAAGRRDDAAGYQSAAAGYLRQVIASGRYPRFGRLAEIIVEGRDLSPDETFDLGLQCLLDGVGAQLGKAGNVRPS
jgi:AcrR family transcriptional regulator